MPHHFVDLSVIIVIASLTATLFGWLKQMPMMGYVVAGIILGPSFMGIIQSEDQISFAAELGVILLLFILGIELPLQSFRQSYKPALVVTSGLVVLSLALMFFIGMFVDLTLAETVAYAFIISLSSTAVAVKLLESVDLKDKGTGQIAISVLIAQDLVFIPMIMVLNSMGASGRIDLSFLPKILAAVVVFAGVVWYLSKRERVHLPFEKTVHRYRDVIPVAALAWCLAGAGLSELAGLSPAFGAFLAGLIIGNSHSKDAVFHRIEPMQNVLIMVFFLSIGMLLDFGIIAENWGLITMVLLGSLLFKTVASVFLLKISLPADRWRCSFVAGLSISQIGEFSFILAAAALSNGILTEESYKNILAVIALSLVVSPIWVEAVNRFVAVAYRQTSVTGLREALGKIMRPLTPEEV